MAAAEFSGDSLASYQPALPSSRSRIVKHSWRGVPEVDVDRYLTMQQESLQLKQQHLKDQKALQELTARLARTEEAAKRVIMLRDPTARGPAAARLLDAERALSLAEAERTEMQATLEGSRQRTAKAKKQLTDRQADLARSRREVHFLARQLGRTTQPVSPSYSQAGFDGLTSGTAAQLQFYGQETSRQKDQEQLRRLQHTVAELRRAAADSEAQQAKHTAQEEAWQRQVPQLQARVFAADTEKAELGSTLSDLRTQLEDAQAQVQQERAQGQQRLQSTNTSLHATRVLQDQLQLLRQRASMATEQAQASRAAQLRAERTVTDMQVRLDEAQQYMGGLAVTGQTSTLRGGAYSNIPREPASTGRGGRSRELGPGIMTSTQYFHKPKRTPRLESMLPEPSSPNVLADMSQLLASLPSSPDSPTRQRSPTATLRGAAGAAAAADDAGQTPGVREVSSKHMVWPSLETHLVIGLKSLRLDGDGALLNQAATLFYQFLEGSVPVQQATARRLSFTPAPLNHFRAYDVTKDTPLCTALQEQVDLSQHRIQFGLLAGKSSQLVAAAEVDLQEVMEYPQSFTELHLPLMSQQTPSRPVALAHVSIHAAEAMQSQVLS